ncbi:hypothetical protein JCM9157_3847 [Halalkalibacter akibai JCM 9157]|uniref:Uncharacterized protein n=1 Tax=Halalkalibacter akibai (strain ATCC 43226 / DSM 21942 / CIP 109018 / JCM 9157 / 1139) TaxID=1236973 RepID=W4QWY9_HALA3|nr:hypothetical protein JCM9157_3847 [Halalkalibacter akibai JCM 9157]
MPFGPDKGKSLEMKYGCRCEDKAIESQVLERRKELKKLREKERLFEVFDQNSLINSDLREAVFGTYHPTNRARKGGK